MQIASDGLKGRVFECSLADLNQVRAAPQSRYAEGKDPTAMLRRKPSACHDWHAV